MGDFQENTYSAIQSLTCSCNNLVREIQEEAPEEPPLIIYKQAPRPETPPPLVIRERPPSPLQQPTEPFVIEKRIPYQQRERKVIIEHLPAPPAKPRDIILEKWYYYLHECRN